MSSPQNVERTSIIICGGGPTGAMLSAQLSQLSIPNIVLERETAIITDPRGIALDEDGIRAIQSIGMLDRMYSRIAHCQQARFIAGAGHTLHKEPFLMLDVASIGYSGHVGFVFHRQPELERAIRDVVAKSPCAELRLGCEVTSIAESEGEVVVDYVDSHGETRTLSGSFLVGADGKTGYVRKKYLEPRGVDLERCEGIDYNETWVALNWHIRLPTPQTHPDFPLWSKGYTPEQVYDAFFPKDFRFLCNPSRPSVCGRFGLERDRLWRFEFVVQPGEDAQQMATYESTSKIIMPYLTHHGSRYGLQQRSIQFPTDCIETLRSRPVNFQARCCNKWALGRVILAGDAAHVFPPFGGQGIVSGFRDSAALAWRLAHLHRHPHADPEKVLQTWYEERKQQLTHSIAVTVQNGEFFNNKSILHTVMRDWVLWSMQKVPFLREKIQGGNRVLPRYRHEPGFIFRPELGGGVLLPQVYCRRIDGRGSEKVEFTDDLFFSQSNTGLLQWIVLLDTVQELALAREDICAVIKSNHDLVREDQAVYLVHYIKAVGVAANDLMQDCIVARIASAAEFEADPVVSKCSPTTRNYDPMQIKKSLRPRARYLLVRRDRYVYAACVDREELRRAVVSLPEALAFPQARL
ncbi:monooxygenase [Neohortaea acidophila]|uniref:Monooxygenase n=1 Tax=Neohortaea acidophila TaxID=245834 RepID=A0A6A6Q228_9PEZI|nr:monooxygenase [Neohortaea acidophila]KAF2486450.1 monooxygenase [Neohortaea acidophila]